jgi:hypothetical protein
MTLWSAPSEDSAPSHMLLEGGVDGKAFLQQLVVQRMHFTIVEETDFMTRFEKSS